MSVELPKLSKIARSGLNPLSGFIPLFVNFYYMTDYQRVAAAIEFIHSRFPEQPSLEQVAAHIHLSPFHFQRLFKKWAGISPKKFLQYINIRHAKVLLEKNYSLADTAFETGLSTTSRLHDLFVSIEGMTPGAYKHGADQLEINYSLHESPFGKILVASTPIGICNVMFCDSEETGRANLSRVWPNAQIKKRRKSVQDEVSKLFTDDWNNLDRIKLHLKGTAFQLKVWEALLKIPVGGLSTYSSIAAAIDNPKSYRAVGSAIAENPVAYLIPCHRVIRSTGIIGDYHWGETRKTAIIGWESGKIYGEAI
jgi:AraC family transcriptional regulator, regulatory protein of adaptative response / methylated-DNA-[protein]-cysteine methyltransferase